MSVMSKGDDGPMNSAGTAENGRRYGTAASIVASDIGENIVSGHLAPGSPLREMSLTPVREAMQRLVTEGLVVRTPGVGFAVGQLKASDIRDVFLTLAFVSGELSTRAVAHVDDAMLAELHAIHHESLALVHRRAVHGLDEKNREFYSIINHATDAPKLRWVAGLCIRYVPRSLYSDVPGWPDITLAGQESMIEALEARDADSARAITESIHRRAGDALAESFEITTAGLSPAE